MENNDAEWFDVYLEEEVEKLLTDKISLSTFKCFLYPNSYFLNLPVDHLAYRLKAILAEQHSYYYDGIISDETVIESIRAEVAKT